MNTLPPILNAGLAMIHAAQSFRSSAMDGFWQAMTFMSDDRFYMLCLPVIATTVGWFAATRIGLMVAIGGLASELTKQYFAEPRPFATEHGLNLINATGYSLPSGHATVVVIFWGLLAAALPHRRLTISIAVIMALLGGLSRVYLGVHYPTDVLAGWALGGTLTFLAITQWERASLVWRQAETRAQIGFVLLPTLFALLIPEKVFFTMGGVLAGIACGMAVASKSMPSDLPMFATGSTGTRIIRALAGLAMILPIYYLMALVHPQGSIAVASVTQWLRYFVLGVTLSCLFPYVCFRTGLAPTHDRARAT